MEDFYREQRRRFDVLMDGDKPVGNRWNYDEENRESPPKKQATLEVPKPYQPREDDVDEKVRRDLDRMELPLRWATTVPGCSLSRPPRPNGRWHRFIEHRLPTFGRYEDAIMGQDWAMSHSLLSVPLNLGVLHPLDAVEAAEARLPAARRARWPRSRASSGRSSAGANTCGTCTGTSVPATPATTTWRAHRIPHWWRELDADAVTAECLRHALMGCATAAGPTTSSGSWCSATTRCSAAIGPPS